MRTRGSESISRNRGRRNGALSSCSRYCGIDLTATYRGCGRAASGAGTISPGTSWPATAVAVSAALRCGRPFRLNRLGTTCRCVSHLLARSPRAGFPSWMCCAGRLLPAFSAARAAEPVARRTRPARSPIQSGKRSWNTCTHSTGRAPQSCHEIVNLCHSRVMVCSDRCEEPSHPGCILPPALLLLATKSSRQASDLTGACDQCTDHPGHSHDD
jgi:hypothetical protein